MSHPPHDVAFDLLPTPTLPRRTAGLALLVALLTAAGRAWAAEPPSPTPGSPAAPTSAAPTSSAPAAPLVPIPFAATPLPGVLTAGQPSEEQFTAVAAAGYKTVVNLRPAGEPGAWDEAPRAAELGLRFVALPVKGAEDLTEANVRALAEVLADPAAYPVMVHCASSNRVGALFALKAFQLDGASAEEALALGKAAGLKGLEAAVRERLGKQE